MMAVNECAVDDGKNCEAEKRGTKGKFGKGIRLWDRLTVRRVDGTRSTTFVCCCISILLTYSACDSNEVLGEYVTAEQYSFPLFFSDSFLFGAPGLCRLLVHGTF